MSEAGITTYDENNVECFPGIIPNPDNLSDQERLFCELYASGKTAGNAMKCYEKAFETEDHLSGIKASILLSKHEIQRYISEISSLGFENAKYMKEFINTTLLNIADEMAYCKMPVDRRGNPIPASSCRGVAVSALKLLMELNGLKSGSQDAEFKIKNENGGSITFNVIVPERKRIGDPE